MSLDSKLELLAEGRGRPKVGTSVGSTHKSIHTLVGKFGKRNSTETTAYKANPDKVKKGSFNYKTKKRTSAVHKHLLKKGFVVASVHKSRDGSKSTTYHHPTSNVAVHHTVSTDAKGMRHGSVTTFKARPRAPKKKARTAKAA
jgi:hypothetical protein